jgi:O-antigen/teichoic acid export membrane protein
MLASASAFKALAGIAVDVIALFMALLSFCGISTPSLQAQGEQRRSSYFNIVRDIAAAE